MTKDEAIMHLEAIRILISEPDGQPQGEMYFALSCGIEALQRELDSEQDELEEPEKYEPGELFIYRNGDRYEIGKVKRPNNTGDGYFCYYHSGDTAANTPTDRMHKLTNAYTIGETSLGGMVR